MILFKIKYNSIEIIIENEIPKIKILPKNIVDNKGIHLDCISKHPSKLK